ncbi:MAG: hypothetical protein Q8R82_03910 [Hyphomonadaceae bacterium]|nr:hypothetical protein [Hyphomonadaceae bacterium]
MSSIDTTAGGSSGSSSPRETAAAAADAVKKEVATFAATVQDRAVEQAEVKKQAAAQTLGDFAAAIRRAGDDLAQHDQSIAGRVAKQAAEGLEAFTRSVSDKQPAELLGAVRDFGRRNPVAFFAGALLVGVAAGRFIRSSAPPEHDGASRYNSDGYYPVSDIVAGSEEADAIDHATYAAEDPGERRDRPGTEF